MQRYSLVVIDIVVRSAPRARFINESTRLDQTELVHVLHTELHSSEASPLQAHSALESLPDLGLVAHWNPSATSGSSRVGQFYSRRQPHAV